MKILNVEVKTHNKREEQLVRIINTSIDTCRNYIENNTFGDRTHRIVKRNLLECDSLFKALYFMNLVLDNSIITELEKEFNIDLY